MFSITYTAEGEAEAAGGVFAEKLMETSGIVATESTSGVIRFLADSEMMCGGYRLDVKVWT